jgi:hypothetical protein
MPDEDREAEVARKVVAIMQTIAEDTEDRRKKAWRKMLGISDGHSAKPEPCESHEEADG